MQVRAVVPDLPQQARGAERAVAPQERLFKGADAFGHSPVEAADQRHAVLIDFSDHGQILSATRYDDQRWPAHAAARLYLSNIREEVFSDVRVQDPAWNCAVGAEKRLFRVLDLSSDHYIL